MNPQVELLVQLVHTDRERFDSILQKNPNVHLAERFVELDEIASMIAWLVSPENSYTTGAAFDLSGGRATY